MDLPKIDPHHGCISGNTGLFGENDMDKMFVFCRDGACLVSDPEKKSGQRYNDQNKVTRDRSRFYEHGVFGILSHGRRLHFYKSVETMIEMDRIVELAEIGKGELSEV